MRYDLTDFAWSVIEPLLPMDRRGPKPKNNRQVLNGIFWVLRAGAPWRDMPERYGCHSRKSYPGIPMVQTGQDWCGDDGPRSLDGSS